MNETPSTATRFDGLAQAYANHRPSYPAAAIVAILSGFTEPAEVVDIGAGTGIGTQLLVAAGAHVVGIEPSDDMRAHAIASGLDVRKGTAAMTGLPDGSADIATAFQAFHWFAGDETFCELRRILRPFGRFAAVWNERDPNDAFANALLQTDRRNGDLVTFNGFDGSDAAMERIFERNGFTNFRKLTFRNAKRFTEEGLIGRLRSLSFAAREGPKVDAFVAETRALFHEYRGAEDYVVLRMRTDVFMGELAR